MFVAFSITLALLFCLFTLAMPFRFPQKLRRPITLIRDWILSGPVASLEPENPEGPRALLGLRLWGCFAAVLFALLGVIDGNLFREHPRAVAATGLYGGLALGLSGVLLLGLHAWTSYIPKLRAICTLTRCGFRNLWIVDQTRTPDQLRETIQKRMENSKMVGIVDVTGYELLGKGPGNAGGVLFDIFDQVRDVPVFLLLCKPEAKAIDPERRRSSILQNLLAEMQIPHSTYIRRLRLTMEAVEALNESRPPDAKIEVHHYSEKPAFQSIITDDSCFAISWHPRQERGQFPYLEIKRQADAISFYQSYRRHFARLWGSPIKASETLRLSTATSRALSNSFAIRPAASSNQRDQVHA